VIAGIVLAAGSSSRLGRPKQLLPLAGEPLIRYTIRRILASSLDDLTVVVGHEAEAVGAALRGFPVRIVFNPNAAQGQSTSVLAGLEALPADTEAALFLLGDQPGIDPAVVDALITAWRESEARVVAPRYTGGIGNPVLFDRHAFPELLALRGDAGARRIVRAHHEAGDLLLVPIDAQAPPDVDTEADYAALQATFAS
jgi:molybdenum cofactor cytidylyltransferase